MCAPLQRTVPNIYLVATYTYPIIHAQVHIVMSLGQHRGCPISKSADVPSPWTARVAHTNHARACALSARPPACMWAQLSMQRPVVSTSLGCAGCF